MDGVTLFGAGLIGAGTAFFGVALVAVGRRYARARVRPPESGPRPTPGARGAQVRPGRERTGRETGPPRQRTASTPGPRPRVADDPARAVGQPVQPRTPRAPQAASGGPFRPLAVAEALDGETLQLGPVPAWKLPFWQGLFRRPGGVVRRRTAYVSVVAGARLADLTTLPMPDVRAAVPGRAASGSHGEAAADAAPVGPNEIRPRDGRTNDGRAERVATPAVATNASRRHDRRTAGSSGAPGR